MRLGLLSIVCALGGLGCGDDGKGGGTSDTGDDGADVATDTTPDSAPEVDAAPEVVSCPQADPAPGCVDEPSPTCEMLVGQGRCQLAVDGPGFFVLADGAGNERFVHDAEVAIDGEGFLASPGGVYWLGQAIDPEGVTAPDITRIGVLAELPSAVTTAVTVRVNLDPAAPVQTFNSGTPQTSSAFRTSVTIFDSRGEDHLIDIWFSRSGPGAWAWNATTKLGELDGSVSLAVTGAFVGTLAFDDAGALTGATQTTSTITFFGADPMTVTFDFGSGADASTSVAGASTASRVEQDGAGPSLVTRATIDAAGVVRQGAADGRTRVVGVLGLALFAKPCELAAAGTGWTATFRSGPPSIAPAGTDTRGAIDVCPAP